MLSLKLGMAALAFLGATAMTGATPAPAKACVGNQCAARCACDAQCDQQYVPTSPEWTSCRQSCHFNYPCDIQYLCPESAKAAPPAVTVPRP